MPPTQTIMGRLLSGWSLVNGGYWRNPDGRATGEQANRAEIDMLWRRGWLRYAIGSGAIVVSVRGKNEVTRR